MYIRNSILGGMLFGCTAFIQSVSAENVVDITSTTSAETLNAIFANGQGDYISSLTLTINNLPKDTGVLMTIAPDIHLVVEDGKYFGISDYDLDPEADGGDSNDESNYNITLDTDAFDFSIEGNKRIASSKEYELPFDCWTLDESGTEREGRAWNGALTLSIQTHWNNAADSSPVPSSITLSYGGVEIQDEFRYSGISFGLEDMRLWDGVGIEGTVIINGVVHSLAVPEPTTATLSLLALATIAARRRRK